MSNSRQLLVADIKGVGEKTAEKLHHAGIYTADEVIHFLPRKYEDYSQLTQLSDIKPGNVVVTGRVSAIASKYVRRGLNITTATLSDDSASISVAWFNQPYRAKHLASNQKWVMSGEFSFTKNKYQLLNPSVRSDQEIIDEGSQLVPVYRQVAGLKTAQLKAIVEQIRPLITMLPELLPAAILKKYQLSSYADAMLALHFPTDRAHLESGRKRIAFQEILELLYAAELNKQDTMRLDAWSIGFNKDDAVKFLGALPFELTPAQKKSAWEILQDIEKDVPMNRMLQGDVGAGKTVVAGMAAFMAAQRGFQTVFMAPTELLARQHAVTLEKTLKPLGISVGLLTGSVKKSAKIALKQQIEAGAIALTIGTHALIQDDVQFHKLGFVIIDEQHRFGVKQRQRLLEKSSKMPHMLSMTATPIPRSLQLTVYGELSISLIKQRPTGRKPIITEIQSPIGRTRLYKDIDQQIAAGRQVYIVCPLIDEGPDNEIKSVEAELEILKKTAFSHRRLGLLHGKLAAEDKQKVMEQFTAGSLDILVSTTVIEVGVDVPNATVMIIEGAERFGLAQLHQLRGRVGRGEYQSYCYLIPTEAKSPSQRLRELERSNDGFYLAEKDLELRGPGEIYGRAQSGALNLQVASIGDTQLLYTIQEAIKYAADNNIDLLHYESMKQRINHRRQVTTLN